MTLPVFRDLSADISGNPCVWENFYDCGCGCSWSDTWSCQVDDDCPRCEETNAPVESFWIGPVDAYRLWYRLPEER